MHFSLLPFAGAVMHRQLKILAAGIMQMNNELLSKDHRLYFKIKPLLQRIIAAAG